MNLNIKVSFTFGITKWFSLEFLEFVPGWNYAFILLSFLGRRVWYGNKEMIIVTIAQR